jgi:SAM-dependent methyltransferase
LLTLDARSERRPQERLSWKPPRRVIQQRVACLQTSAWTKTPTMVGYAPRAMPAVEAGARGDQHFCKATRRRDSVSQRLPRVRPGERQNKVPERSIASGRPVSTRPRVVSQLPVPAQRALRRAKREMIAMALIGRAVECPVCYGRFRHFLAIPGGGRVLCPRCLSLERHRRTVLFLRGSTNLYSDSLVVLHVAPELGLRRELSQLNNLEYVTADLNASDVSVVMDVTAIDFPNDTFDVILCSHVLEHVPDDRRAMREFRRVVKPTGWALINVPSDPSRVDIFEDTSVLTPEDRLAVFGQADHVRIYSHEGFLERLREAGFAVEVDPLAFSPSERRRFVLDGDGGWDHAYLCRPL